MRRCVILPQCRRGWTRLGLNATKRRVWDESGGFVTLSFDLAGLRRAAFFSTPKAWGNRQGRAGGVRLLFKET
jgi:hypothetical protein